ncbi:DUF2513 domain-containing protein [Pasteurella sp. PK-2025]|uniref:DUF2513 domain-containing protein n=1 Tax=Pasteurella sp. PK-2025 TaxID=3413133 RepID=UPI00061A6F5A|nr:hypothetical protein I926_00385 [Pasteurella multocida subsp. multocida OH4807]
MKRDWELIRKILVQLEEQNTPKSWLYGSDIEGYDREIVVYHYKLLGEAGLIESKDVSKIGKVDFVAQCLTWQGHEFLDKIRSDTAWNKIKAVLMKKGVDLSFEAIKVAGTSIIASLLK